MRSIKRRSFLKSLGAAATASTLATPLQAFGQTGQVPSGELTAGPPIDPKTVRIFLNQLGYQPNHAKIATVLAADLPSNPFTSHSFVPFRIWPPDRSVIARRGWLSLAAHDAASGDMVAQADFSGLQSPGLYCLEVAGVYSDLFTIAATVYADALRLTTRAFYGQRCGCSVNLGGGYNHPPCHLNGAFDRTTSGRSGVVPNTGGWHDAGDYGRYSVNSGLSTGTLLWAWEMYPDALRSLTLEIPESGGTIPDFLAEIKWNLDWMLSMQDPADGGVWQKQTSLKFCAFIMPQDDHLTSEIIGTGEAPFKSTCATADFAAVMAIAARCYKPYDAAFAARCLAAARLAWTWSRSHPNVTFKNPPTVTTGAYSDNFCNDEILWASAELFRTTREPQFESATLELMQPFLAPLIGAPSWANVAPMGLWAYAFATADHPTETTNAIHRATLGSAVILVERMKYSGYGNSLIPEDYHWGSNSTALNQSLLLLMSNHFYTDRSAINAALSNLHYLLGCNCFGVSWVTQLGHRPFLHPHHRPSVADGLPLPWPGLLSGGPNAYGGDAVANAVPKAPPMRMWVDDHRAYSMNEVAINWNAPLVFLLAAANSSAIVSM